MLGQSPTPLTTIQYKQYNNTLRGTTVRPAIKNSGGPIYYDAVTRERLRVTSSGNNITG